MLATDIRSKLHHFIETVDDEKAAKLYSLFENEIENDDVRRELVKVERQKYLDGADKSYSWDEVKNTAMNKEQRNGLLN